MDRSFYILAKDAMKTLAIFPDQVSIAGKEVYADFARSTGLTLVENSLDADAALIWSVLWQGRMRKNEGVFHHYRNLDKTVFVVETGVIKRNQTYKVSANGTDRYSTYWNSSDGGDLDRSYRMLSHIRTIKPGNKALICAQNPFSLNWKWGGGTVEDWIRDKVYWTETVFPGMPIEIRPHPRYSPRIPELEHLVVKPKFTVKDDTDLLDAFRDAAIVINQNSYPGIQAGFCCIPTWVHHSSLAAYIGYNDAGLILPIDRNGDVYDKWLQDMACTEFYHEEIQSGFAWDRIRHAVNISKLK